MKFFWRLLPFLSIFLGVVIGGFVLIWAKDSRIFSYVIPSDANVWLPGKEVGFALAWNWSFSLVLMPVMVALVVWIVQSTRRALADMHTLGMVVDNDFVPVSKELIDRIWRWLVSALAVLAVIVTALFVWFAVDQYQDVIGQHFAKGSFQELRPPVAVNGSRTVHPPTDIHEFDWSVAALIDNTSPSGGNHVPFRQNRNFALFVYVVYLGLFLSAFFTIIAWMFVCIAAASLTVFENPGVRIVPSLRSQDPRRGFETLEPVFVFILLAIFIAYFAGYLVVTQNLYLRTTHLGWGELFFGAIADALGKASNLTEADPWKAVLVAVGFIVEDRSGGATIRSVDAGFTAMAGMVVGIVATGAVILMLRRIARHGSAQLSRHRHEGPIVISVWPMEWPSVTDFVIAIFLAAVALFLFRLGALLFLGALMLALYRLWKVSRAGIDAGSARADRSGTC